MQPSWLLCRDMGATGSPGPPPTSCLFHRPAPLAGALHVHSQPPSPVSPMGNSRCLCCSLPPMARFHQQTCLFCASLSPPSSCNHTPVPASNECHINSIPSSAHVHFSTQVPPNCPYPALLCQRRQVIPIFSCPLSYYCLKFSLETPGFRCVRTQLSSHVTQQLSLTVFLCPVGCLCLRLYMFTD